MVKESNIAVIKDGAVYILQAGTPVFIKTADLCAMTGKSNQWIGQLTSQGVVSKKKTAHGSMYELIPSVKSYCAKLEQRSEDKDEEEKKAERQKLTAEASLKKAKATVATLEAKELLGKMHRSEDVAAMTEDLVFTIRSALNALPGRVAVDAAAAQTAAEVSEIIRAEVYKVLEELSGYHYDAAKYEERMRERMKLDKSAIADEDDEE